MFKSNHIKGLCAILLLLFSFLILFILNEKKGYDNSISQMEYMLSEKDEIIFLYEQARRIEGNKIEEVVKFKDLSEKRMFEGMLKENKFIYLFSEANCNECIHKEIENLTNSEVGLKNNTIFLIDSDNRRFASVFVKTNKIEFPVFVVDLTYNDNRKLDIPPFYFIVDSETRRINSVFFPRKVDNSATKMYFKKVVEDYFH